MVHRLIGCIDRMSFEEIRTRFFYYSKETSEVKDVTKDLVRAIDKFNEVMSKENKLGIPYEYKNGLANYSYGCGLSHYLQSNLFEEIFVLGGDAITFPLHKCYLIIYTPSDIKDILECRGSFDPNIEKALREII